MYWPFFRSKQEELLAIRELASNSNSLISNIVVPIIKPHSSSSRVEGQLNKILSTGLRFSLILNTNEGSPIPPQNTVIQMEANLSSAHPNQIFPALEVRAGVTSSEVASFISRYQNRTILFVHRAHNLPASIFTARSMIHVFDINHCSHNLISQLQGHKVILRDGFQKQAVNGNYPPSSRYLSDLYSYSQQGFNGFGDFASIGDVKAAKGGGAASHVALHLTEAVQNQHVECRHFVSSINSTNNSIDQLYYNAVAKLVQHIGNPRHTFFKTQGVDDYCAHINHYPGLGSVKRWSTKHHIEWIHRELRRQQASAWI
ncbi:sce7725 family protein [Aeromonas veronii]|uniref:sce7725 family protein n=1 Tax=Aeromonas veronii TaxID=654 RepID=UPI000F5EF5BE|nr:sce7725 family protein [Aeromonas veronii]MCX0423253.1 sce7725 family protein [Aeromonas veronii]QNF14909.1 sce7725 family protein [Aeromonas jandaei]WIJ43440.1 sce7725 family protein [Aeromonas veronii]